MHLTLNVTKDKGYIEIGIALPYYATPERLDAMHDNAKYIAAAYRILTDA